MGQEVLLRRITSNQASRILQTAIQMAAFLGAAMAGFVLNWRGMNGVLLVNVLTYACGSLCFLLLNQVVIFHQTETLTQSALSKVHHQGNKTILWLALLGLAMLTIQIAGFNLFVPLMAQHEKHWSASQFGVIDAIAGSGAFLSTFILVDKGRIAHLWIVSFVAIFLCDASFYFLNNIYFVSVSAFCLGFFINAFRIKQREMIYDNVSNTHEILEWTGRITAMTAFIKALSPLILSFMVFHPSFNFMLCGLFVGTSILLIEMGFYFQFIKTTKNQLLLVNSSS